MRRALGARGAQGSQRAALHSGSCDTVGDRNERGRQLEAGSGGGEVRTPDIDRNDPPRDRSVNALPVIIVKSHCALTFVNVAN
jgi:hypothetical protein